jgi:aminopeptidase N
MGLYVSNDSFFTQCEAEGFRRITYFLDRPDVMASYTVTLRADKDPLPGAAVQRQPGGTGRPGRRPPLCQVGGPAPKALLPVCAGGRAAGVPRAAHHLARGNEHLLQVYVRPGDLDKTEHAMNSLMASVAWDEARFGLPLDLERFMIVATSDFNMGAMENKGLNIFNTKYVLASQATATDTDFANIEAWWATSTSTTGRATA